MKIKVNFSIEKLKSQITKRFDFDLVQKLMSLTKWVYFDSVETPTIDKLKSTLFSCLKDVEEYGFVGTGGFNVEYNDKTYTVSFELTSFVCTNKSVLWDNEDHEYFKLFVDKLMILLPELGSHLQIYDRSELETFLKSSIDGFISGVNISNLHIPEELQFSLEEYNDDDFLYTVTLIGIKREFKL
jgi:hypothetical protein